MGSISLKHIDLLVEIGIPLNNRPGYRPAQSLDDISEILTTDSRKKADVYLNSRGVSIKQAGGSFAFNRLQRANIFNEVVGIPRVGWRDEVYEVDRKTVYFLMIEKKK
jgi:hypothetical protein